MMNIRFITVLLLLFGVYACSKEDDLESIAFFDPLSVDTLWYNDAASGQTISLNAGCEVEVEVPQGIESWCRAEVTGTGKGQTLTVYCLANEQVEARYSALLLKAAGIERKLTVVQYGMAPVIKAIQSDYLLSADTTILSVPIISNVNFEVRAGEPWVHYQGIVKGQNSDTLKLGLSSSIWPRRSAEVLLKWEHLSATVTITQVSADTVYQSQGGPVSNRVNIVNGKTNYESPYGLFIKTYDKNTSIYLSGNIPGSENLEMEWYFEKAVALNRMLFIPDEADGVDYAMGKFYVDIREEGSSEFKEVGLCDFRYSMSTSTLKFEAREKKVDAVRLRVLPPDNGAAHWALGCQEVEFYSDDFDATSIFTDELCTDLKEGVTYEQIMAVEDAFYRNLARYMYLGVYDKEFRVQEYLPYSDLEEQKLSHKSRGWGILDNATGISVREGEKMVLLVGNMHGEQVKAVVVDWKNATFRTVSPRMSSFALKEGVNEFTPYSDGLLYLLYFSDNYEARQTIKVHIPTGKVNGYFDIARHDAAYWKNLLNKSESEFLDVKGKLTHLVFPVEDFRTYCPDNIGQLIQVYDSIVVLEHELSGLYKHNRMYPNRMLFRVTYEEGYYMYAYDYQTAYHYVTAAPGILKPETFHGEMLWGVSHEIGHVHQNKDITWNGMTEVSNNVFSMHVQTTMGGVSRLMAEDYYLKACNMIAIPGIPYGMGDNADVFAKLVPLWQLQLYFAKVLNKPEFYMDLYEAMRLEPTPSCPQLNFVELCFEKGQVNLEEFFRFWGFLQTTSGGSSGVTIGQDQLDATLQKLTAMNLQQKAPAIQYLRDDNIELFKALKPIEKGQAGLSGSQLTLSGWKNVVAWEVYEGNQWIQVAFKDQFDLKSTASSVIVKAVAADGSRVEVDFRN